MSQYGIKHSLLLPELMIQSTHSPRTGKHTEHSINSQDMVALFNTLTVASQVTLVVVPIEPAGVVYKERVGVVW